MGCGECNSRWQWLLGFHSENSCESVLFLLQPIHMIYFIFSKCIFVLSLCFLALESSLSLIFLSPPTIYSQSQINFLSLEPLTTWCSFQTSSSSNKVLQIKCIFTPAVFKTQLSQYLKITMSFFFWHTLAWHLRGSLSLVLAFLDDQPVSSSRLLVSLLVSESVPLVAWPRF